MADARDNKPSDRGAFRVSGPSKAAKLTLPKQVPQLNPRSKQVGCVFSSVEGTVKSHGGVCMQGGVTRWGCR